jgi:hypothetical protein
MRSSLPLLAAAAGTLLGCERGAPPRTADGRPVAPLAGVSTLPRASLAAFPTDTLSDSARVTLLLPEADEESVAYLFTDPARGVVRGLGLLDAASGQASLVWPDSVSRVTWSGPHALTFSTTRGLRGVVDVHAATLEVSPAQAGGAPAREPPSAGESDVSAARARATAYVDSAYFQPAGAPQRSSLRYQVRRVLPAPDGSLAVAYVAGSDAGGRLFNPVWLAMDVPHGRVIAIDEVTGPAVEMPQEGGAWTATGRFLYTKRMSLWEAGFMRRAVR